MAHPSISMSDTMLEEIDNQAGRQNRSGWFREAAQFRLVAGYISAAYDDELPEEWWLDALEAYIQSQKRDPPVAVEA